MIFSISWRNVWRNKMRSIVMITAIALGLFAGVFSIAFMQGVIEARIDSATKSELSHIQIHAPHFSDNNDIAFAIPSVNQMVSQIEKLDSVKAVCYRLVTEPFIVAAHGTSGGKLIGIVPEKEKEVTDIYEHIIEGTYLESSSKMPPVLVGQKLAVRLHLKTGTKLNIQMVDKNGDLSVKGYRVSGIYQTTNTSFDEMVLFVRYDDLKSQLDLGDNLAHEIAISIQNGENAPQVKNSILTLSNNNIVQTWKELSPEMSLLTDSMDQYLYIFILIILLALCFGIINTMLMSVLERTKEIGMLMAVGMNKRRIFMMIMLESVLLTISGGFVGIAIGVWITRIFETKAIDLSMFSEGLEKYGYASQIYTSLKPDYILIITLLVIATGLISAIYPARKALKLNPAEATRTE